MPRSTQINLSIEHFTPLYQSPEALPLSCGDFYIDSVNAELTLYSLEIQKTIYEVAEHFRYWNDKRYNVDDIVASITKRLFKEIQRKQGLRIESPFLKNVKLLRGYFMKYVQWRMKDMLSTDKYWKRWSDSSLNFIGDLETFSANLETRPIENIINNMQKSKDVFELILNDPKVKITPLNRLKSIVLYTPDRLRFDHISCAYTAKQTIAKPERIWQTWCNNTIRYRQIRLSDHKDLKNSRRFCTWVLFRPDLTNEHDFMTDPTEQQVRENRFNRPVNHTYHKLIKECVIFILLTREIDNAQGMITTLLVPKNIKPTRKENLKLFKQRRRKYQCRLEKQIDLWYHRYHNNRFCAGARSAIAQILQPPKNTSLPSNGTPSGIELNLLVSIERSANHIKCHYR